MTRKIASTWWGRKPFGQEYNKALAGIAGGIVVESKNGGESGLRTANGKMPRLSDLLPLHEQAWIDANEHYIQKNLADSQAN